MDEANIKALKCGRVMLLMKLHQHILNFKKEAVYVQIQSNESFMNDCLLFEELSY